MVEENNEMVNVVDDEGDGSGNSRLNKQERERVLELLLRFFVISLSHYDIMHLIIYSLFISSSLIYHHFIKQPTNQITK